MTTEPLGLPTGRILESTFVNMKKIQIKVPKKEGDKFSIGWGARPRPMHSAATILNRLQRLLVELKHGDKTSVIVKYGKGIHNETIRSNDVEYLVYTTTCFLEDYLPRYHMIRAEKRYQKSLKGGEKL